MLSLPPPSIHPSLSLVLCGDVNSRVLRLHVEYFDHYPSTHIHASPHIHPPYSPPRVHSAPFDSLGSPGGSAHLGAAGLNHGASASGEGDGGGIRHRKDGVIVLLKCRATPADADICLNLPVSDGRGERRMGHPSNLNMWGGCVVGESCGVVRGLVNGARCCAENVMVMARRCCVACARAAWPVSMSEQEMNAYATLGDRAARSALAHLDLPGLGGGGKRGGGEEGGSDQAGDRSMAAPVADVRSAMRASFLDAVSVVEGESLAGNSSVVQDLPSLQSFSSVSSIESVSSGFSRVSTQALETGHYGPLIPCTRTLQVPQTNSCSSTSEQGSQTTDVAMHVQGCIAIGSDFDSNALGVLSYDTSAVAYAAVPGSENARVSCVDSMYNISKSGSSAVVMSHGEWSEDAFECLSTGVSSGFSSGFSSMANSTLL